MGSQAREQATHEPALITESDLGRIKTLLQHGRRSPEDHDLALGFLRQLVPYVELLRAQRTALRIALRSVIVDRDGRLCYFLGDDSLIPMPVGTERAVRAALAMARPAAG